MIYKWFYKTPSSFDNIIMNSDGEYLTGLWFVDSNDASEHALYCEEKYLPIFKETSKWLDIYFSGKNPDFTPKYKIENLTPFRQEVSDIMKTVPFGKTITYNEIAKIIAKKRSLEKMSSQAVGGAVGWNPICIIIPCHRVIGTNGNLTGYGGWIKNKIALLANEKNDIKNYFLPKSAIHNKKSMKEKINMKIIPKNDRTPQLINKLLKVWEDSVRETHKFLSNEEILEIKKYVPSALLNTPNLIISNDQFDNPIAFMGIEENKLEMLFVASKYRGKGIGKQMIIYGINNFGVNTLAVNEDNPEAKGFYEHMGFKVYQRNELDDQGNPYPVLYMKLEK